MDSDYYVCLSGGISVGRALTASRFDVIMFTGGTGIGKIIAREAANNLIPCILELGGKSPTVIDESADIDWACRRIAMGRYFNAG